jgi:hypothetical protein
MVIYGNINLSPPKDNYFLCPQHQSKIYDLIPLQPCSFCFVFPISSCYEIKLCLSYVPIWFSIVHHFLYQFQFLIFLCNMDMKRDIDVNDLLFSLFFF